MQLFSHFPFLTDLVTQDDGEADKLERLFQLACQSAGVASDSPDALPIGIDIMADYATGLGHTSYTMLQRRN